MKQRSALAVLLRLLPVLAGLLVLMTLPALAMLESDRARTRVDDVLDPAHHRVLEALAQANALRADAYTEILTLDNGVKQQYQTHRTLWTRDTAQSLPMRGVGAAAEARWRQSVQLMDEWIARYGDDFIANANAGQAQLLPSEALISRSIAGLEQVESSIELEAEKEQQNLSGWRANEVAVSVGVGLICLLLALSAVRSELALRKALRISSESAERLQLAVRETNHRVKNNLQTIGGLIEIQRHEHGDRVPREALDEILQQVHAMAAVHDFLSHEQKDREVSVAPMLRRLVELAARPAALATEVDAVAAELPVKEATSVALIVNELVLNAGKHGATQVHVELDRANGHYSLMVADNGPGLPEGFDLERNSNLGLALVETLARHDLRGELAWSRSGELSGAQFDVQFPAQSSL